MLSDYVKAKKLGDKAISKAVSSHSSPYLVALDEIVDTTKTLNTEHLGVYEISLKHLIGTKTVSRAASFANNFMPIMDSDTEFAYKWSRLYDAQVDEGIRDPVKVYEYKWQFYVEEGNKRASVLKYLDVPTIMADVTRIQPQSDESVEAKIYEEYLAFFKCVPNFNFRFSKPGSYQKLAAYAGGDLTKRWSSDALNRLEGARYRFEQAFLQKSRGTLAEYVSDAMLVYLSVYPYDSLLDISKQVLGNRIEKLWQDILAESKAAAVKEEPDIQEETTIDVLTNMLFSAPAYSEKKPLRAAFMYKSSLEASAWASGHEKGRLYVENCFKPLIKTTYYDQLEDEARLSQAIDDAIANKADVIFTTSASALKETLKASLHYPGVCFYNCSLHAAYQSVPTYDIRMYEVKFLLGALAACLCDNHKIGYLADYPIYGAIANVNAFAIGAAMIDPQCRVYLKWSSVKTYDWHKEMEKEDIHVISAHDMTKPAWGDHEQGLIIADWQRPHQKAAAPVIHWGKYYELILADILEHGKKTTAKTKDYHAINYWYGISSGVIDLWLNDEMSYYTKKMVKLLKEALIAGRLNPFSGELHSQHKVIQPMYAPRLHNDKIIEMNWLNDNIVGDFPELDEWLPHALDVMNVSGIIPEDEA